jgi:acetyltransferase-like isoleucine patch superfamily enzyme
MKIASNSKILAKSKKIGRNVKIGKDVLIQCKNLIFGNNVNIGLCTEENFRSKGGTIIRVEELILEDGVTIGREVLITGGKMHLGKNVKVKSNNTINVKDKLQIEGYGTINENCEISGRDIMIGQELWMLPYAKIGGGSAFEVHSKLRIGHYCHISMYCLINTARPVYIGDEVGLGTRTALYTHGAYPSALKGFPVAFGEIHIGDYTWIPGATVNPGVKIGKNCVIGVNSLVTKDIPDGSFAAGSPAKIIKENSFPQEISHQKRVDFFRAFFHTFAEISSDKHLVEYNKNSDRIGVRINKATVLFIKHLGKTNLDSCRDRIIFVAYINDLSIDSLSRFDKKITVFDLKNKYIYGITDKLSERMANQLRRYGIRFYSRSDGEKYVRWK